MTEEHLCVLCAVRGRRPDHYERAMACEQCRVWLAGVLRDIAALYPALAGRHSGEPDRPWSTRQLRDGKWVTEPGHDPASAKLPTGATGRTPPRMGIVTGTRDNLAPVDLDVVDLTGDARPASIAVRYRTERPPGQAPINWAAYGGDPDQIGHLSVATELEFWVQDWITMRGEGEHLPLPLVPPLAGWLSARLTWAIDEHPAIDEFATALTRIYGALRAYVPRVVEEDEKPPQRRAEPRTAPCPACDMVSLWWWPSDERVRCDTDGCNRVMTESEYAQWARLVIADARGTA